MLQSSCGFDPEAITHAVACEDAMCFSRPSQRDESGLNDLERQGDISQSSQNI